MQLQIIIKYGSRREYPPERQAAQAYRSCEGRMGGKKSMSSEISKNFIEQMIDKDLAEGVYDTVHTRFPPEPNGYLSGSPNIIHIDSFGHRTRIL